MVPETEMDMDILAVAEGLDTCVHCPCEPVLPSTLVTLASLMGCTRLVSMMAVKG